MSENKKAKQSNKQQEGGKLQQIQRAEKQYQQGEGKGTIENIPLENLEDGESNCVKIEPD